MKISYAITVCNEFIEIQRLVNFLINNKRSQDEIVIQFDSKGDCEIEAYLRSHSINGEVNWYSYDFESDFSKMKNRLTNMCNDLISFNLERVASVALFYCLIFILNESIQEISW